MLLQALEGVFLPCYLHPKMSGLGLPHVPPQCGNPAWRRASSPPLLPLPFCESPSALVMGGMETGREKGEAGPFIWVSKQAPFLIGRGSAERRLWAT